VPLWMFPVAIACGNTFILKPSEKVPLSAVKLGELLLEAGLPPGVFNIVHGDKTAVDALLTHPLVRAVSFVGSTGVARHIYATGTAHGKRVQAAGGAKNHLIIMPDADLDLAGRAFDLPGDGFLLGPSVVDRVRPDMRLAREEIFGPVLSVVRTADLDEALALGRRCEYGNGACIFTRSGWAAREFKRHF